MTLYDSMVESYAPKSAAERLAVQQEVMQLIALAGLAQRGHFASGRCGCAWVFGRILLQDFQAKLRQELYCVFK